MSLVIYNTLSRDKEPFAPLDAEHVRMYVCGPTVYDYVHVGNGRPVVVFDVLYRLLKRRYPRVTYVRNITDIDDRIMVRAADNGETIESLTARTKDDARLTAPRSERTNGDMVLDEAFIQDAQAREPSGGHGQPGRRGPRRAGRAAPLRPPQHPVPGRDQALPDHRPHLTRMQQPDRLAVHNTIVTRRRR